MKKEYIFNTLDYGNVKIIINDNSITISRSGFMSKMKYGHTGDRTFLINQISAVEVKNAGFIMGHIQFILAGTQAKKQPLFASQKDRADENTIMFSNKKNNIDANEIKEYIENYNNNSDKKIDNEYDKLFKLKKLLDEKVITQEEFEKEKSKILNN